ncbi:MAG: polysaccharide ABC transporter ATP-binding protein [Flavobacteriaceae bacterium]
MSDIILKVENISKQYRLGVVGTGTISHDLNRWWYKVRGKEDPFLKIGESNDRSTKGNSEYVWALKDINFEVKRGEVLGIIGKNGAGKSTLLKILSKVTSPTTGSIKSKGRIASLLEVGTGFHPEMTGKENIFLNGAILGMTKKEIKAKLDEIVSFSGCERYIDTPVKRYSSGMKVRLAFAVAAHLEPDILVVDEVLAVGDAEFQKKAIGKMQDISNKDGRTVLFVSHDMAAVSSLCKKCILIKSGVIEKIGEVNEVIEYYLSTNNLVKNVKDTNIINIDDFVLKFDKKRNVLNIKIKLSINTNISNDDNKFYLDFAILNNKEQYIVHYISDQKDEIKFKNQSSEINISINQPNFKPGKYSFTIYIHDLNEKVHLWVERFNEFVFANFCKEIDNGLINKIRSHTIPVIIVKFL